MSPSCRVNRSSSSAVSSRRASSAMRCTSCAAQCQTRSRRFYRSCAPHSSLFVQEPAIAVESARRQLGAQRRNRRRAVVADREVIEHQRLDVRRLRHREGFFGGGVDRLAAIGFLEKRRVVHEQVGVHDERRIDRHRIARVREHDVAARLRASSSRVPLRAAASISDCGMEANCGFNRRRVSITR